MIPCPGPSRSPRPRGSYALRRRQIRRLRGIDEAVGRVVREREELHELGPRGRVGRVGGGGHARRRVAQQLVLEGPAPDRDGLVGEDGAQALGQGREGGWARGGVGRRGDKEDAGKVRSVEFWRDEVGDVKEDQTYPVMGIFVC